MIRDPTEKTKKHYNPSISAAKMDRGRSGSVLSVFTPRLQRRKLPNKEKQEHNLMVEDMTKKMRDV